ncbi:MAG: hypothetical protein R2699_06195 [Acidimicrobiales bacterium]|nr:hypothetical protein [Acidimicrobiales bacterium]
MPPRNQHYFFAHRLVPGLATRDPAAFIEAATTNGDAFAARLWERAAARVSADSEEPGGLRVEVAEEEPPALVSIWLPEPIASPEAHVVSVVWRPGTDARTFTLERSESPITGEVGTVVCEWVEQRHVNHGRTCLPEPDAWTATVRELAP